MQFNLFEMFPLDCHRDRITFYDVFTFSILLPFAVALTGFACMTTALKRQAAPPEQTQVAVFNQDADKKVEGTSEQGAEDDMEAEDDIEKDTRSAHQVTRDRIIGSYLKHTMMALFVLYPGSASTTLHVFFCQKIGDETPILPDFKSVTGGASYLVADVEQECYTGQWAVYAVAGTSHCHLELRVVAQVLLRPSCSCSGPQLQFGCTSTCTDCI